MNPSAPDPIGQPDIDIGFEIGNDLAWIEALVSLPDLTAAKCNDGEPFVSGDEALGAGAVEKFNAFQAGFAESLFYERFIRIDEC